jgi:tRNA(Arg) A34 adenosine deaminase TadA
MCLSALYWAGVRKIYYGNSQEDAEAIDFSDKFIYEELARPKQQRRIPCIQAERSLTIGAFQKWAAKTDKVKY